MVRWSGEKSGLGVLIGEKEEYWEVRVRVSSCRREGVRGGC